MATIYGKKSSYLKKKDIKYHLLGLFFQRKAAKYHNGRIGEINICDELEKLPDNYIIFQDMHLPHRLGNIDFVVIGPAGIYAIEVKSHKGKIDFNGQILTLNGHNFEKDFLKQAIYEAMSLKDYLKNKADREYFINPVLVFSSPYASLRFGFNPVNNVIVIGKKFLLEYFRQQQLYLNEIEINTLKEALMPLIKR